MALRLRIPEALEERGLTPYAVAKLANGRISATAAHRLASREGRVKYFDADLLEALAEVLGCEPGELIVRDGGGSAAKATKKAARRRGKP